MWKPGVEVTNKKMLEGKIEEEEAYWIEFPAHGILAFTQRYIGSIGSPTNLREVGLTSVPAAQSPASLTLPARSQFPFDRQIISLTFESFHWKAEDLHLARLQDQAFQLPPRPGSNERWLTMSDQVKLNEWTVTGIEVIEQVKHYPFEDR